MAGERPKAGHEEEGRAKNKEGGALVNHPLEQIALKALETGAQDEASLIASLSGRVPMSGPLMNAYRRVAKDVLDSLAARELVTNCDGWYRLSADHPESTPTPKIEYNLRAWWPRRLFKDSPITTYDRTERGRQTRWNAEAKPEGECWRVTVWRLEGKQTRRSASGAWVWDGFLSWEDGALFAEEFIQLKRNPQTWKTADNETRNRMSEMESKATSARG